MLSPESIRLDEKFDSSLVRISIISMKNDVGQAFRRKPRTCRGPIFHAHEVTDKPQVEAHLYAGAGILSKPFLSFFLKKIYCKYPQHIEVFLLFAHYIQKLCKISSLFASLKGF